MKLIVGLGNLGEKYANNRHNIGFMVVEEIAQKYSVNSWKDKFHSKFSTVEINGEKVGLLLPQTYMNDSGRAVQAAMAFFKVKLADIIVIHDELDLPLAEVRIKVGGGNAGHNGLKSITSTIGNDYKRIRLGIDHPGDKDRVTSWVLGDFAKNEQDIVSNLCQKIATDIKEIIKED